MLFDGLLWMAISNSMPGLNRFRDAHLDALGQRVAEVFRRVTEGNLPRYVHGTMAALSQMQARNQGAHIQTGSTLAYRGIPEQDAYCGAKYAIQGFTDSLRCELIHDGSRITVTMVELPAVNTPQFEWARTYMPRQPRPVPPVMQPASDAVFRVALQPHREYWIGWSTLQVILGSVLLPGFLDRYLARNAVEAQEMSIPVTPNRRDNLMMPVRETSSRVAALAPKLAPRRPL